MKKNKNKNENEKAYDEIMFNQAGSMTECTGLIPSAIENSEELSSYEDVFNFSIPESVKKNIEQK